MLKVYLSKASRAPVDIVNKVREQLLARNLELVEATEPFNGHQKMLECDNVIFVPNALRKWDDDQTVIGKGQAEQINAWLDNGDKDRPYIVVSSNPEEDTDNFFLAEITEECFQVGNGTRTVKITNPNDFVRYGLIEDDSDEYTVEYKFGKAVAGRRLSIIDGNPSVAESSSTHLYVAVEMGII